MKNPRLVAEQIVNALLEDLATREGLLDQTELDDFATRAEGMIEIVLPLIESAS